MKIPSLRRAIRMVQRSLTVYKHTWMVIFSGFFEPVFYLLGIGLGLGGLVPDIDGVAYSAFVLPGLLASSCLNGAVSDGMFNIFFKLHFQKTYDGILATPMACAGYRPRRDVVGGHPQFPVCRRLPGCVTGDGNRARTAAAALAVGGGGVSGGRVRLGGICRNGAVHDHR